MATSARRAGWIPLCADPFGDRDLYAPGGSVLIRDYPASLINDLAQLRADAWCYTGGLENEPEVIARLEDEAGRLGPLWGVGAEALPGCRDPFRVAELWRGQGLSVPDMLPADRPPSRDGNWLLKPIRGSGGWQIRKWIGTPRDACDSSPLSPRNVYFQRRIPGDSLSALFLVSPAQVGGGCGIRFISVSEQILEPGTCRFAGAITPVELPSAAIEHVELALRVVADTCRLAGLIGVDFIFDGATVWPLEINPRYTASVEVVELAYQSSFLRWHRAACEGRGEIDSQLPHLGKKPRIVGKQVVYARQACRLAAEPVPTDFATGYELPALADISPAGTVVETGDPVCTVFAAARSVAACREELQRRSLAIWEWYAANCPGEAPLRAGRS
ncbi:MAG: ATP-grasp domain-containing protein [Planctomycetaceae bacterium]|nr:ATP-grasp domain-containing protein [Planctomycetaceae bacterium]